MCYSFVIKNITIIFFFAEICLNRKKFIKMSEIINTAKLDAETLTAFQKKLHDSNDRDEDFITEHNYLSQKVTWSGLYTEKLREIGKFEYELNKKFHCARKLYAICHLPQLRVEEKYENYVQIALCNNFMHNVITYANLTIDGKVCEEINTISMDNSIQFDVLPGSGRRQTIKKMVGDKKFTGQWMSSIPAYSFQCPLPFDYTTNIKKALPLFLCASSDIIHVFKFNTKLSNLIRMRVRATLEDGTYGPWTVIKYNHKYLHSIKKDAEIKTPEIWAKYSYLTAKELDWQMHQKVEMYMQNQIVICADKADVYGQPVTLDVQSAYPIKCLRWGAINMTASKYNNHSNYTTDVNDINKGWSPIKSMEFKYGNSTRMMKMDYYHHADIEPYYGCFSTPYDNGYHCVNFCNNIYSVYPDGGLAFPESGHKVTLSIENTDPTLEEILDNELPEERDGNIVIKELMQQDKESKSNNSPLFLPYILLLISRKVIFEKDKKVIIEDNPLELLDKIDRRFTDRS